MALQRKKFAAVWPKVALFYFCAIFPLGFILPPQAGWENGPIEMLQNFVLLLGVFQSLYYYSKPTYPSRDKGWLCAAGLYLLLFGREISWGRVFFVKGITENGPVFWSMRSLPYHQLIHAGVGLYLLLLLVFIFKTIRWRTVRQCLQWSRSTTVLLLLCSVLALLGDKGPLLKGFINETTEELAELLIYLNLLYFTGQYKKLTTAGSLPCTDDSPAS